MIGRKGCFQQFEAFDFFQTLEASRNQMLNTDPRLEFVAVDKPESQRLPQICLIDHDESFCQSMARFAEKQQLELDWFLNFKSFSQNSSHHWDYILVGIDQQSGPLNLEWTNEICMSHAKTPIILISSSRKKEPNFSMWPKNVIGFSEKGKSLEELVDYLGKFKKDNFDLKSDKLTVPSYLEIQIKN